MNPTITFHKHQKLLVVEAPSSRPGLPPEIITMKAISGGWRYGTSQTVARSLPAGKWLITEDPGRVPRSEYFGLFYRDGKVNDQFSHQGIWRNGIRFGLHFRRGSHGCIMTMPNVGGFKSENEAKDKWLRIQALIRAAPKMLINYQNNEDQNRTDQNTYTIRAYSNLTVKEF